MQQPVNKSLIIKYFSGLCSRVEANNIEEWLEEEENEFLMQQWLWEDWQDTRGEMPAAFSAGLKKQIDEQIAATGNVRKFSTRVYKIYYGVAVAIVFLLITTAVLFFNPNKQGLANKLVYKDSIINKSNLPFKALLQDGSVAWLNAGAVIHLADGFNKNERRIKVSGEVFLNIAPDARKPFYAEAGRTTIQVLGTSFNLEAYPEEKNVRVSLIEGKLAFHAADSVCILSAGQSALYKMHQETLQVSSIATTNPSAWINGKIVLNNLALMDALDRLGKLYNTPINYNHALIGDKKITGEFNRDAFPVVLQSVLFVHNLKFEALKNGRYRIY